MSVFNGASGLDVYYGQGDADTINGFGGDDYLFGGAGNDTINGGDGNDLLYGEDGADIIDGGAGDDRIIGDRQPISFDYDRASDILKGGTGADSFTFEFGWSEKSGNLAVYDHIVDFSQAEGDRLNLYYDGYQSKLMAWAGAVSTPGFALTSGSAFAASAIDSAYMGVFTWVNAGTTYLMVDVNANNLLDAPDFVLALDGVVSLDRYAFPLGDPSIPYMVQVGSAAGDTWSGGVLSDVYHGLAGDDVVSGLAGNDFLYGEGGGDTLNGGDGGDFMVGAEGNDILHGGAGDDTLYAGGQYNGTYDQGSSNTLYGEDGADILIGGEGQDTLYGGAGNDRINASFSYLGPSGGDTAYGGDGDDEILTNGATAYGEAGNDKFTLGGSSTLTGGTGADTYNFNIGYTGNVTSYDTITDFNLAEGDRLAVGGRTYFDLPFVLRGALDNANFSLDYGKTFSSTDYGPGFQQVWTWNNGGYTYLIFDQDGGGKLDSFDYVLRFTGNIAVTGAAFDPTPFVVTLGGGDGLDNYAGSATADTFYGLNGDDVLHGAGGSDTLYGNNGQDALWGDAGADTLSGGAGDDTLYGGADGDTINGGSGNDYIDGGDGDDTLTTAGRNAGDGDAASAVNTIHGGAGDDRITGGLNQDLLYGGSGTDSIFGFGELHGEDGNDTLSTGMQFVAGAYVGVLLDGGAGDDYLAGSWGADLLFGGAGKDSLQGGYGADTLHADLADSSVNGGEDADLILIEGLAPGDVPASNGLWVYGGSDYYDGNDVIKVLADLSANPKIYITGGGGQDRLDLAAAAGAVQVDLNLTGAQQTGMGAFTLYAIEDVVGGDHGATLTGDGQANGLTGGLGQDHLNGGGGDDRLAGAAGDDVLDGGTGFDTVVFTAAATVDLTIVGAQNTGEGLDSIVNVERFDGGVGADVFKGDGGANTFYGFDGADQLFGRAGADVLDGGNGADLLDGGLGDDQLTGGLGNDTIEGGLGSDTAIFDGYFDDYVITTVGDQTTVAGFGFTDTLNHVENLRFLDRTIYIAPVSISVAASSGGSALQGGDGADLLTGGDGNDVLDGGVGDDIASYATAGVGVTVSLLTQGAQDTGAGLDTLIGIENLTGSAHSDVLIGDGGANRLDGGLGQDWLQSGVGDDALVGGDGDDSVWGGAGSDTLDGGSGNDTIDGGAGVDLVTYAFASSGVEVDLSIVEDQLTRGGGIDTLISIEGVIGSDLDDLLTGSNVSNTLRGGAGDDILRGGGGGDFLYGEAGADIFVYGAVSDAPSSGGEWISDFSTSDRIDVSAIDADKSLEGDQAFHINGQAGHAGDIGVYYSIYADVSYVSFYTDNTGNASAVIMMWGDHTTLAASDFIL